MRNCFSVWLSVAALAAAAPPDGAVPIRMISAPSPSPDGRSMVFEWCQDLWLASSDGGEAKRIVGNPGRDAYPRFSPDGGRIVFSSDRSGSMQVYSIPVSGGEPFRHTWQTEGNELECLSPDGTRAIVRGLRDCPGYLSTRLMQVDLTAERRELVLFDATAHSAAWSPDGGGVLFCRRGEQLYRKGYRGSRASQIWMYRIGDRSFSRMVAEETEARSPLWMPDGHGFYYVSTRDGTANLWCRREGAGDKQLTHFKDDGVITPDISADGSVVVFRRGFEVYRYLPSADREPVAIELWTRGSLPDVSTDTRRITGVSSADFTKDLKQVVFSAAGDLWFVAGSDREKPGRLTETPAAEEDVRFSPAGDWLYYLRDDGLAANYFRARFENGALRDEVRVTEGTRSKSRLKPSADGAKIAWIEGTGDVFTAAADGSGARRVYPCWDKPTFDWSPDGRWLAVAAEDRNGNRDVRLVSANGDRPPLDLTVDPAFEGSPRWSPDGRCLVFTAKRGEAGKAQLWRIRFGKRGPQEGGKAEMISTKGIEPTRVIWAADSKSLFFQSATSTSKRLYQIGADGHDMHVVAKRRGIPIRMTAAGDLLWRVDRTPEILGREGERFPISMTVSRPRQDVLTVAFRRIWRMLGESFYDAGMNGRDWNAMRLKYENAARNARDSRQFDRVISYLRGELNASHLAFTPKPWPGETPKLPHEEKTAHPGIVFQDDDADPEAPLRVGRLIPGSPVAMLPEPPRPGDSIVRIAGEGVTNGSSLRRFFEGAENRPLPVVIRGKDGGERVIELRCISYQKVRALEAGAGVSDAAGRVVAEQAGIAYLAVPDMSVGTLAELETFIYQASLSADSLILDFRNNGGGREADRMLNIFCQPEHAYTIPRGGPRGYPIARLPEPRWDKPMVVLCNQDTFSNAEIFCHAMKHLKRAPLVGEATAGGVISAVKISIPDAGELQVPFRGWYGIGSGENFDKQGARPDFPVELSPSDEVSGRDPQLAKAIEILKTQNLKRAPSSNR